MNQSQNLNSSNAYMNSEAFTTGRTNHANNITKKTKVKHI